MNAVEEKREMTAQEMKPPVVIVPPSAYLAIRKSAIPLREQAELLLRNDGAIIFDLTNVRSVSESYADEFFGVLTEEFGLDQIGIRISVEGATEDALTTIATAISRRAKSG